MSLCSAIQPVAPRYLQGVVIVLRGEFSKIFHPPRSTSKRVPYKYRGRLRAHENLIDDSMFQRERYVIVVITEKRFIVCIIGRLETVTQKLIYG